MNDFCYVLYKIHFIEKENVDTQDPYFRMRVWFCLLVLYPLENENKIKNKVEKVMDNIKQYGSSLKNNVRVDSY